MSSGNLYGTVIKDDYEHFDHNLEYILENVLDEAVFDEGCEDCAGLKEKYNTILLNRCQCCGQQDDCSSCCHGGSYVLDTSSPLTELVLSNVNRKDLIYECTTLCNCSPQNCINRLVQNGPRENLKIIDSVLIGSKGLMTTMPVPKGAFICEYAGELLTRHEALRRAAANEQAGRMNYLLCLKENSMESRNMKPACEVTIIDPSRKGNVGRYLNHSCAPNCEIYSVRVDCPVPKVAIFAKRQIKDGEELSFHYGDGVAGKNVFDGNELGNSNVTPCLCHSDNCSGYIPNLKF